MGRLKVKIVNSQSTIVNPKAFTLIELLVVIAVIALLLALLIPVLRSAREQGQRAVCLSNLKQLTLAWLAYADEHDGKIVYGSAFGSVVSSKRRLDGWVGEAFKFPESRSELVENPNKGALWPWIKDVDIYRCPRGWAGHAVTYSTVVSANGLHIEGTYVTDTLGMELHEFGKRIGNTVLRLSRLTEIMSPSAAQRAVFLDKGCTPLSGDFHVYYLYCKWSMHSPPPINHSDGMTLSMADGHVEYWRWKGRDTVKMRRKLVPALSMFIEVLDGGDYEPQTKDGLYDLQRLQKATWGRIGYTLDGEGEGGP
jgi:prepilin-type N-terminal cleavage/methylation domain-containing protein/prepilin-type processing-associated H-X9-DG protein